MYNYYIQTVFYYQFVIPFKIFILHAHSAEYQLHARLFIFVIPPCFYWGSRGEWHRGAEKGEVGEW